MKKAFAIGAICMAFTAAVGTPPLSAQDKKGPLAELPSKPGPHVEKIKALGDNEWLNLGSPAADPKWGKARGSSWGAKAFIPAPDRRGAFLFGEGVHGYVKPDGHGMDDLWFYDLNAHAWTCLYPGMNTKTFTQRVKDKELVIDESGQLIDKDRRPVPVHQLVHAWGYLAYDPEGEAALLEPHVRAFDITGRPMRNWIAVEPEGVGDDDQLKEWVERAVRFVRTLPKK